MDEKISKNRLYRQGDLLAMTINPCPLEQHYKYDNGRLKTYEDRKDSYVSEWKSIFKGWMFQCLVSEYKFYLEISKHGLLHWHGYVRINNPEKFAHMIGYYKYIQNHKATTLVNIDIDSIDNIEIWQQYISKDADIMGVVLDQQADTLPTVAKK